MKKKSVDFSFKKNISAVIKISLLDMILFSTILVVFFLWTKEIVKRSAMLMQTLQKLGLSVESLSAQSAGLQSASFEIMKMYFEMFLVLMLLFAVFLSISSFFIYRQLSKFSKKISFMHYFRQYFSVLIVVFALFFIELVFLAIMLSDVFVYGYFPLHYLLLFLLMFLFFVCLMYFASVMLALIPKENFIVLFLDSAKLAFFHSKKILASFLLILICFLILIYAAKFIIGLNALAGLFFVILVLFPFFSISRMYFIHSLKNQ